MSTLSISAADGAPLLMYHAPTTQPAWRANFIHPLFSQAGATLTEDAPADHLHHRGIFWAWRRIFVADKVVDSWVGDGFAYAPSEHALSDGGSTITTGLHWLSTRRTPALPFVRERTLIHAADDRDSRTVRVEIGLRALVPNVAVAGTDDDKGYGGPTIRFAHAGVMRIASEGRPLAPRLGALPTGPAVDFSWSPRPDGFPRRISVSCRVDGRPWTAWVLREGPGMQNCAFPGRAPHPVPTDRELTLELRLHIEA